MLGGISGQSTPTDLECGRGFGFGAAFLWVSWVDEEEEDGAPTAQLEPAPE